MSSFTTHGRCTADSLSYAASVMARNLKIIRERGEIRADEFPSTEWSALSRARDFFGCFRPIIESGTPENPLYAASAMHLAMNTLVDCVIVEPELARADGRGTLRRFHDFLGLMTMPRELSEEELVTARQMQFFFRSIDERGQLERASRIYGDEDDD